MKQIILILALLSVSALAVAAEPTGEELRKQGMELFKQSTGAADYAAAEGVIKQGIDLLKQAAEKNDAEAQFVLGTLVLTQSVPPGIEIDAPAMFLKAAHQGHEDALFGLCALLFQKTRLSPEDEEWLLKQLEDKAAGGSKEANSVLAPLYFILEKKDKFDTELAKLTQQADGGDIESQYLLGTILVDPAGMGFPKDAPRGLKYLEQAASAKHLMAQLFLGELYINHEDYKNVDKGLSYLEAAAEGGDPTYENQVGVLYYQLGRSDDDYKKAFKYLSAAAAMNVREAQFYLANMYQKGQGVAADPKKAEELFKESEKP